MPERGASARGAPFSCLDGLVRMIVRNRRRQGAPGGDAAYLLGGRPLRGDGAISTARARESRTSASSESACTWIRSRGDTMSSPVLEFRTCDASSIAAGAFIPTVSISSLASEIIVTVANESRRETPCAARCAPSKSLWDSKLSSHFGVTPRADATVAVLYDGIISYQSRIFRINLTN